jgi:type IV secretory pathway TrbL component
MRFRLHIVHESDAWLRQRLDSLHIQNELILSTQGDIMATIKQLVDDVAEVRGKVASVGALIAQLREQITGLTNGNLPADVQAQVDQAFDDAEAAKADISKAIDANGSASSGPAANPTASNPSVTPPTGPSA